MFHSLLGHRFSFFSPPVGTHLDRKMMKNQLRNLLLDNPLYKKNIHVPREPKIGTPDHSLAYTLRDATREASCVAAGSRASRDQNRSELAFQAFFG